MTSFDAMVSVVLADVGFDYLIVDCEHRPMDKVSALNHVRAAKLHGDSGRPVSGKFQPDHSVLLRYRCDRCDPPQCGGCCHRPVLLIETQEGIRNLKDIAAVDGIDLLVSGPGDLSQDMGLSMFNDADRLMDL